MTAMTGADQYASERENLPIVNLATLARIIFWFASTMGLGDGLTTWYALEHSDTSAEGNPIMRWPMEHWGILVACLLKVFFNILIFWWISRRIMGRTLLPQSARLWLDRVWAIVSLQRFRSWIWYIFTETARACWLILCGSDQDQVEKTITRYQTILKSVGRAWHWLTPRLAAVEFVGATVLLGMVVGNNLRVVAEIKGWV